MVVHLSHSVHAKVNELQVFVCLKCLTDCNGARNVNVLVCVCVCVCVHVEGEKERE